MLRKFIDFIVNIIKRLLGRTPPVPEFFWPTLYNKVTQEFGINPQAYMRFGLPGHEGIDIRALHDTSIFAVWDGEVVRNNYHNAYGNHIRLKHIINGNEYESIYAHFSELSLLRVGDTVTRGQFIGKADSTGNSTGSHLHFGLKQFSGTKPESELDWPYDLIDPTPFFSELQ